MMARPRNKRAANGRTALVLLVVVALAGLTAACSSGGSGDATPLPLTAVDFGAPVTLAPGEGLLITGENVALIFRQVTADSRCPSGVNCITAGTAKVLLALSRGEPNPGLITIEVPPGAGVTQVAAEFIVDVQSLTPDPPVQIGTPKEAYRLTVSLSRQ